MATPAIRAELSVVNIIGAMTVAAAAAEPGAQLLLGPSLSVLGRADSWTLALTLREEDLDGDGAVDVRTIFEHGRLVRRELSDLTDTPDDT